jgi:hypothetical protein
MTVREVARMFEAAGVARTERSITNWCQPNKLGIGRLDAYFDPNERKFFITPQSVEQAITEEKAKTVKGTGPSEVAGNVPKDAEEPQKPTHLAAVEEDGRVEELEKEIVDLKIANRGKDYFIERLQKEREEFAEERRGYVEKLISDSRKIGELESKLLQLSAPTENRSDNEALKSKVI